MPNIAGLVGDPQFTSLSPADQRTTLSKVTGDNTFSFLSDEDLTAFKQKMGGIPSSGTTGPLTSGSPKDRQIGPIPLGTPVKGGPVLPNPGSLASTVVGMGTGYGASKIAEHLGAPDWLSTATGILAGGLAGGGTALVQKLATVPEGLKSQAFRELAGKLNLGVFKGKDLMDFWKAIHPDVKTPPEPPPIPKGSWTGQAEAKGPVTATGGPTPVGRGIPITKAPEPTASVQTGTNQPQFQTNQTTVQGGPTPQGTGIPQKPPSPGPLSGTTDPRAQVDEAWNPYTPKPIPPPPPPEPLANTNQPEAVGKKGKTRAPRKQAPTGTGLPAMPAPPTPLSGTNQPGALQGGVQATPSTPVPTSTPISPTIASGSTGATPPTPTTPQTPPTPPSASESFANAPLAAGETNAGRAYKTNQTIWTKAMARKLADSGVKSSDIKDMNPSDLDQHSEDAGISKFSDRSDDTKARLSDELDKENDRRGLIESVTKKSSSNKTTKGAKTTPKINNPSSSPVNQRGSYGGDDLFDVAETKAPRPTPKTPVPTTAGWSGTIPAANRVAGIRPGEDVVYKGSYKSGGQTIHTVALAGDPNSTWDLTADQIKDLKGKP